MFIGEALVTILNALLPDGLVCEARREGRRGSFLGRQATGEPAAAYLG